MIFQAHRRWVFILVLLFTGSQISFALTSVSLTNTITGNLTNATRWNPVGTPTADNDVYITNYIGGTSISLNVLQTTAGTGPTNGNLTMFNNGGVGVFTLVLSNSTYMVTNNTTLGTNAVVQLGSAFLTSTSVFSNNNLSLTDNSVINFDVTNASSPSALMVAGAFTNGPASTIATIGGSAAALQFTSGNSITNQGKLSFTGITAGVAGNTGLVLQVAGGANSLINQGTITLGAAAALASRASVFSNQFVNAGFFALTNSAATTTNFFSVTGLAGTALTNQTGAILKLFTGSPTAQNVMTLNSGGFMNAGTLMGESTVAGASSLIALADPSGIFSNAVGGWTIATNNGVFTIQAGGIVNQGTMLASNAAALVLAGPVSGTGLYKAGRGATLTFSAGGSLDFVNSLSFPGGTVVVQGQFTNSQVGTYSSVGGLIITNGNLYNAASSDMLLGANAGDNSTVTVANAGSLYITNAAGNARLVVGQNGSGTFNLNTGATLVVNQLLVTNNFTAGPNNSIFNFNGGALTTSNAANAVAFDYIVPAAATINLSGTWNMLGGSNLFPTLGAGTITIADGGMVTVANGAIWNLGTNNFIIGNGTGSNRLVITGGGQVVGGGGAVMGTLNGAPNNSLLVTGAGSVFSNASLVVGGGYNPYFGTSDSNTLTISQGGRVIITGQMTVGASGSSNSQILVTDPGTVLTANYFFFNSGGGNSFIVSNGATATATTGITGSNGGGNNSYVVTGTGSVFTLASFYIGGGFGGNNSLLVSKGGLVLDGSGPIGINGSNNSVFVTDPGSVWSNTTGAVSLGTAAAGDSIVVSNKGAIYSVGISVGPGATNILTVTGSGSSWNDTGNLVNNSSLSVMSIINSGSVVIATGMTVGSNTGGGGPAGGTGVGSSNLVAVLGTGSVLHVTSGSITLGGPFGSGSANQLLVAGGGQVSSLGGVIGQSDGIIGTNLGYGSGLYAPLITGFAGNSNQVTVTDPGSIWNSTGNTITIGNAGLYNMLVISNGGLVIDSFVTVGNSSSYGTNFFTALSVSNVTVLTTNTYASALVSGSGSVWSNSGSLTVGNTGAGNTVTITNNGFVVASNITLGASASSTGNLLSVSGGAELLDNGSLTVGSAGGGNMLAVSGGAQLLDNGSLTIGQASSFNSLTATNATTVSHGLTIGAAGSSNNAATLMDGLNWNFSGNAVNVGNAAGSYGNSLTIRGAVALTNLGLVTVGGAGGGFNQLIATNTAFQSQGLTIGNGSSNNSVSVQAFTTWNLGGQNLAIGNLAATGNVLTIDGGLLTNVGLVSLGSGKAGTVNTNATGNSLVINNGGMLAAASVNVGLVAGDNNNSVQVLNGSLLEANSLTIAAGTTGNTISNRNSIYQFTTATPTITPNGLGSIAINNGTIAFRGIDNADVTANQSTGALSGINFAGANTFMLNAASNINALADQTYTFQTVAGNPSNYVNLVMVNGQTEYGNGDLNIGATGTLLISNTTAGIDGNFQNLGTASVVNATVNFANTIMNHGRLTLQNATLNTDAINYSTGTIHGNGTISSDVNNLGTISPVGTLTFSGNLTLLGSSTVVMELTGYGNGVGTNDVLNVGANFQYAGTLVVTNTTSFAYAYGQEFYLFNFGSQTGDFAVTNLPNLTPYGLAWNTSQLDSIGLLIVVPEPAPVVLLIMGGLLLWFLCRRQVRT